MPHRTINRTDQGHPIEEEFLRSMRDGHHSSAFVVAGPEPGTDTKIDVSFVIPLKDEQATIVELYERIAAQFGPDQSIEIIFIDDGSCDASWSIIESIARQHPDQVRGLKFRRNCGKAAALTAGFRAAHGEVIFTLDADLQDDPTEIPRFLAKLDEGYDLVSGWKQVRHDPWHKVLPSRIFNRMLSHFSGVTLHDHNCGFKCYRAEVAKSLTLHGEMHRMIPATSAIGGFRSAEIVVQHHPRLHGVSKYGIERFIRGFMDMITLGFMRNYRERPSHFFGAISAGCFALAAALIGIGLISAIAWQTIAGLATIVSGVVFAATGVLTFGCGIVAELVIRGGLRSYWKLPIVKDTSHPFEREGVTQIPTAYQDH
ncbi:glycosyltransferase family 2 protein [Tundrisphaera lichenicola]|uniref:glycosyltransferase family 2 protein n=1 Tax=Tundrisphaera lichenicola TaxID=2029860 RepID=UPI003EB8740C